MKTTRPLNRRRCRAVCMLAYTYYPLDSRVRREAAALCKAGYRVDVICLHGPGDPPFEVQDDVRLWHVPMSRYRGNSVRPYLKGYSLFFVLALYRLALLYGRRRYAVIQVHTLPDFLILAASPFKLLGARLLLDIHDTMPELYASRFGGRREGQAFRVLVGVERVSVWVADKVLVVDQRERELLAARGVPWRKMHVVMNSADEGLFSVPPAGAPEGTGPASGTRAAEEFVVLYHGTVVERYGLETLVRAVALLRDTMPTLRVNIVGDGDFRERLRALIGELALDDIVRLIGAVPTTAIPQYILAADACVAPLNRDIFTENILPVKLLEAVAMERPVVCSRTPTIMRYFSDEAVCYFTPGDPGDLARALTLVATEPDLRQSLVTHARKEAQPYRWSASRQEYLGVVDALSGAGSPAAGATR